MLPEYGKIINGNCIEKMKDLDYQCIDYALTSPPYNRKRNDKYEKYDDTLDDYYQFLNKIIARLLCSVKHHSFLNLQANYYNKHDIYRIIGDWERYIQNIIIWEKSNPLPANGLNITNAYELILVLGDKPLKAKHTYTKNVITTSVNTEGTTKIHKAVMKQDLADWIFESFIPEGSTVIDPMMGLGTTAISAEKYGCKWCGYEIVPEYINKAWERIIGERKKRGLE